METVTCVSSTLDDDSPSKATSPVQVDVPPAETKQDATKEEATTQDETETKETRETSRSSTPNAETAKLTAPPARKISRFLVSPVVEQKTISSSSETEVTSLENEQVSSSEQSKVEQKTEEVVETVVAATSENLEPPKVEPIEDNFQVQQNVMMAPQQQNVIVQQQQQPQVVQQIVPQQVPIQVQYQNAPVIQQQHVVQPQQQVIQDPQQVMIQRQMQFQPQQYVILAGQQPQQQQQPLIDEKNRKVSNISTCSTLSTDSHMSEMSAINDERKVSSMVLNPPQLQQQQQQLPTEEQSSQPAPIAHPVEAAPKVKSTLPDLAQNLANILSNPKTKTTTAAATHSVPGHENLSTTSAPPLPAVDHNKPALQPEQYFQPIQPEVSAQAGQPVQFMSQPTVQMAPQQQQQQQQYVQQVHTQQTIVQQTVINQQPMECVVQPQILQGMMHTQVAQVIKHFLKLKN